MKKSIGKTLQILRTEKGLSQGDIERRTGLLRCYLSRVENGHTIPSIETLRKLAAALEVSLGQLVDPGEGAPAKAEPAPPTDKRQLRFWNAMRKVMPVLKERDRRILVGLGRRMAAAR